MLNPVGRPIEWSDERVILLKKLWDAGLSCSQIALELGGTTRNAIIGKVHRLHLPGRMTVERKARCYRSGPVNYEIKQQREAERAVKRRADEDRAITQRIANARKREAGGTLPPLRLPEKQAPADFLALTFAQLEPEQCRYPRGEGAEMRFCGQPRMMGRSYCAYCYHICHTKPISPTTPNTFRIFNLAKAA